MDVKKIEEKNRNSNKIKISKTRVIINKMNHDNCY